MSRLKKEIAQKRRTLADAYVERYASVQLRLNRVASIEMLYRAAFKAGNIELCWRMREEIQDRITGRAFRALNPTNADKSMALYDDKRIQVAIQNLHLPAPAPPALPSASG